MKIHAHAALEARSPLAPFTYSPASLGPHGIKVKISHCGVCHSDIHLIDNDWGISRYPLVPGHEIIGIVEEVGEAATHVHKGQRVGIGWQRGSCMECEHCLTGQENFCAKSQATCVAHHGGFADAIVVDGRFAFPIPESLDSVASAPLLCGGITVYSPFRDHAITARARVGIIGIGGLGHMALQFARALGCDVTAFSTSPNKEREARTLGADRFVTYSSPSDLTRNTRNSLDFILSTVSADLPWDSFMELLAPRGKLCVVGAAPSPISLPAQLLISGAKTLCGSPIGSRPAIQEMLEFAARHRIHAQTETLPMSEVNGALDKVRANKARYRMVLEC